MIVGGPLPKGPHCLTFVNYLKKEYHKHLKDIDYDYYKEDLRHENQNVEKDWKYIELVMKAKERGEKVGKIVVEEEIDPAAKAAKEAKLAEQEAKKAAEKAAKEAEEDDGTSSSKKKK